MRLLFFVAFGLAALWAGGFLLFIDRIPAAPMPSEKEADAIVSLTGGSGRVREAIRLLQDGKADTLFISGVGEGITVEQILKEYDLDEGSVPVDKLVLGHAAQNTAGNAQETKIWADASNVKTILLVTAHYHMPRAKLEFQRTAPDIIVMPHPVFPDEVNLDSMWTSPATVSILVKEYHKFLMAWQGVSSPYTSHS